MKRQQYSKHTAEGRATKYPSQNRMQLLLDCIMKILCEDPKKVKDNAARTSASRRTLTAGAYTHNTHRYYKTRCIDERSPDEEDYFSQGYPKAYAMRRHCC